MPYWIVGLLTTIRDNLRIIWRMKDAILSTAMLKLKTCQNISIMRMFSMVPSIEMIGFLATRFAEPTPVAVFIHGGGFVSGEQRSLRQTEDTSPFERRYRGCHHQLSVGIS